MSTTVQKWGHSLGLRIPKVLADALGIQPGSEVTLKVEQNQLIVVPERKKHTLDELVGRITTYNLHEELLVDPPQGRELI